eukprot:6157595-Ditylum_brightwellii.AAC.1
MALATTGTLNGTICLKQTKPSDQTLLQAIKTSSLLIASMRQLLLFLSLSQAPLPCPHVAPWDDPRYMPMASLKILPLLNWDLG